MRLLRDPSSGLVHLTADYPGSAACGAALDPGAPTSSGGPAAVTCARCHALAQGAPGQSPGAAAPFPAFVEGSRLLEWGWSVCRLDLAPRHRQPAAARLVVATVVAIAGSLAADALLVALGTHLYPSTRHYGHFAFPDYAKLTVVGVLFACAGWPIVTRITRAPRALFAWAAVAVTLVLFLPDLLILWQGQPARAVGVLMVMHVAIAIVTYCSLVLLAPVRPRTVAPAGRRERAVAAG